MTLPTLDKITEQITFANWSTDNESGKRKILKEYVEEVIKICAYDADKMRDVCCDIEKEILKVKEQIQ